MIRFGKFNCPEKAVIYSTLPSEYCGKDQRQFYYQLELQLIILFIFKIVTSGGSNFK